MAVILVIDDSPTEAEFVRNILTTEGMEVVWASDAQQGIQMAAKHKPDLILMDVVMPGMNGFQATRRLSRDVETSEIPVIMLTTKDQETDKIWAKRNGAAEYICKPPKRDELLSKIIGLLK